MTPLLIQGVIYQENEQIGLYFRESFGNGTDDAPSWILYGLVPFSKVPERKLHHRFN